MTHANHHAHTARYISEIPPSVFMDKTVETDGMVQNIYRCCRSAAFVDESVVREMIAARASAIHMVVVVLGGGVFDQFPANPTYYDLYVKLAFGHTLTKDLPLSHSDFTEIINIYSESVACNNSVVWGNIEMEVVAPYYVFPADVMRTLRTAIRNTPLSLLSDHPNLYGVLVMSGVSFPVDAPAKDIELLIKNAREEFLSEEICNRLDSLDCDVLGAVMGTSIPPKADVVNTINARLDAFGVYLDEFPTTITRETIGAYWEGYTGLELPSAPEESESIDEFAACTEGFLKTIKLANYLPQLAVPDNTAATLMGELLDVVDCHTAGASDETLETIAMALNTVVEAVCPTTPVPPKKGATCTKHYFKFTSEHLIGELISLGDSENVDVVSVSADGIDFTITHPHFPLLAPQQFITAQQVKDIIIQVIYKLNPNRDDFRLTEFAFDPSEEIFSGVLLIKE